MLGEIFLVLNDLKFWSSNDLLECCEKFKTCLSYFFSFFPTIWFHFVSGSSRTLYQSHQSQWRLDNRGRYCHHHRRQLLWRSAGHLWHHVGLERGELWMFFLYIPFHPVMLPSWMFCSCLKLCTLIGWQIVHRVLFIILYSYEFMIVAICSKILDNVVFFCCSIGRALD